MCDTAYQLLKVIEVLRILSVLDPCADLVAEDAAEVFVAREGEEASGVGQHTDEVAEASQISQGSHLLSHTYKVIIEPPCGTLLQFACGFRSLEAA